MKTSLDLKRDGFAHNINDAKRAFELLARMVSDKGVKVVFRGTTAKTNWKTIYLPELTLLERPNMSETEVEEAQDFLDAIRGYLFHEVSHILFTDETVYRTAAQENELLSTVLNFVEDVRIEAKMAKEWRGAGVNFDHLNNWVVKKNASEDWSKVPLPVKLMVAFVCVVRFGTKHPWYAGLDDVTRALLKKFAPEVRAVPGLEDTADAVALARRIIKKLMDAKEPPKPEKKEDENENEETAPSPGQGKKTKKEATTKQKFTEEDDDEAEDGMGDDEEPEGAPDEDEAGGGDSSLEDSDDEGGGSDEEASDGEDSEVDEGVEEELRKQLQVDLNGAMTAPPDAASHIQKTMKGLPVDNSTYRVFTTENDRIAKAPDAGPQRYSDLIGQARQHFGILKRNLANLLKARANTMTVGELEEGDLDTGMLYRLASGMSNKVFKEDFEQLDTNLGVVLLVNESGSMCSYAGNGLSRMDLARITSALLGEVLDSLAIPFAIYGHTTGTNAHRVFENATDEEKAIYTRWGATRIAVYKDFNESFKKAKTRIPTMSPQDNTHDAEALLFAANQLLSQKGLQRRIVITIDDGEPYPNMVGSYSPKPEVQGNLDTMLAKHQTYLKEVAKELEASGVEVLAMGMGSNSVKDYYTNWLHVTDVAAFPAIALKELRKLIAPK